MNKRYFVQVEVQNGERTYCDYSLTEAEAGKEEETFYEKMKEIYYYTDEDFDKDDKYFDGFEVHHALEGWSEINDHEWGFLKRWFFDW